MRPATQFYGDRSGAVKDPCGNGWWIATRVEDVPPDELPKRTRPRSSTAIPATPRPTTPIRIRI